MTVTQATTDAVLERDMWCCVACGARVSGQRGVHYSIHHRHPRKMGGSLAPWIDQPSNLVTLCGSGTTLCHGEVESNRTQAEEIGLLVPTGKTPAHIPIQVFGPRFHGERVYLDDDAQYIPL